MDTRQTHLSAWAMGGAMSLTGASGEAPSVAPAVVASAMRSAADELRRHTARWGERVVVDGPALLGERAAIVGLSRRGDVSVGGGARFVEAADGWVVLNLPRPEDVAALPALVGAHVRPDDWTAIAARLRLLCAAEVVEVATVLGLAAAEPYSEPPCDAAGRQLHRGATRTVRSTPLVIDLTSLWAGPLLTSLLGSAGARVVKVEGRSRPDGARRGSPDFFALLNHGKECVTVDFDDPVDVAFLRRLMAAADLIVEGSRPRVMDRLGVSPCDLADDGVSWLSITAHGRTGAAAQRIGFGDDAAVAGGLLVDGDRPHFVGDAIADPIAGLVGAGVAARLLAEDHATVVDLSLARAAAWAAGEEMTGEVARDSNGWAVDIGGQMVPVAAPRCRAIPGSGPGPGCHDSELRAEFG